MATIPASSAAADAVPRTVRSGRYLVGKRLGTGGFGYIHRAKDTRRGGDVAIKFERKDTTPPQLAFEVNAYLKVAGLDKEGVEKGENKVHYGVPRIFWYGHEGDFNVMVMECLGDSLEGLLKKCKRSLSIKTVCMVADQALTRIERVHEKGLIHRDLKPDNLLMGTGHQKSVLFLVDFGLVRPFLDPYGVHLPFGSSSHNAGTVRYCSIGMQQGWLQSRRDDLESLAYVFLYLARGRLPWQGIKGMRGKERDAEIKRLKIETPVKEICAGLPPVFARLITYARDLDFEAKPDYGLWRREFARTCAAAGGTYDGVFDWDTAATLK